MCITWSTLKRAFVSKSRTASSVSANELSIPRRRGIGTESRLESLIVSPVEQTGRFAGFRSGLVSRDELFFFFINERTRARVGLLCFAYSARLRVQRARFAVQSFVSKLRTLLYDLVGFTLLPKPRCQSFFQGLLLGPCTRRIYATIRWRCALLARNCCGEQKIRARSY